ncbi:MAG: hypothetical protein M0029_03520 [Actinomycetota bacterium]|jgi:hypothetical protein|nr:hypothetical protein [Actinomycetota bacterium]
MPSRAELSSLSSALTDVTRRITAEAEAARSAADEDAAHELFAVERALVGAGRRLQRLLASDAVPR